METGSRRLLLDVHCAGFRTDSVHLLLTARLQVREPGLDVAIFRSKVCNRPKGNMGYPLQREKSTGSPDAKNAFACDMADQLP
jgi:hypothetical protein